MNQAIRVSKNKHENDLRVYEEAHITQFLAFFKTNDLGEAIEIFESDIICLDEFMLDILEKRVYRSELPWHSLYIVRDYYQQHQCAKKISWYKVAIKYWEYKGFNDDNLLSSVQK